MNDIDINVTKTKQSYREFFDKQKDPKWDGLSEELKEKYIDVVFAIKKYQAEHNLI